MKNLTRPKRIAAIHDLSGYSRVSLTVVIPVLNTMGFNVCALPTAILSNGTQFSKFSFLDLTDEMKKIVSIWKEMNLEFDAIYSGYLGSPEQIDIVSNFIDYFKTTNNIIIVDPVLGDNGKLYNGFDDRIVNEMKKLIKKADIITPNLTEMSLLLNKPYSIENNEKEIKFLLKTISQEGPEIVIVTNVPVKDNPHLTSVYAYDRVGDKYWKTTCQYLPAHYPGLGDTFTSVITGALLQGDSLPLALDRATQFCYQGIRATFGHDFDNREGVVLEKVLENLNFPVQITSFEMI